MGSRDSAGQRDDRTSDLAAPWSPQVFRPVLLPYEKQLAATIGLTEYEYSLFKKEVERRSKTRPAAYAHIPDIRNEPATTTAILVNLAIGLVLTGVSLLLAPKPKEPNQIKQIKQDDLTGPSRYNSTYGFDSVGDIATWATPVPIPFGKYVNKDGITSGGIVVTPDLVWSRLFSYGNHQIAKLLYAGEYGSAVPAQASTSARSRCRRCRSSTRFTTGGPGNNRLKAADKSSARRAP